MAEAHEKYMRRCLALAALGKGNVSPNPMVGCVIVHNDTVIGEGYHQVYGGPHAEVNAIQSVEEKSLLKESTVYVNLEPCSHFGKTPPCADLLVQSGVKKVVIANKDPNPLVNGTGIHKLLNAGIEVVTDVLQDEGILLNKVFFTQKILQRPYVILKWAQSADGYMGKENERTIISGETAQLYSHKLRHDYDAIMVGTNTAIIDNPMLTDRYWNGKQPMRVLIDKNLNVPKTHHLFDGSVSTVVYNELEDYESKNLIYKKLTNGDNWVYIILDDLNTRNISSLIVEGGGVTLQKFIDLEVWDELHIIQSKENNIHYGIKPPRYHGIKVETMDLVQDVVTLYKPLIA